MPSPSRHAPRRPRPPRTARLLAVTLAVALLLLPGPVARARAVTDPVGEWPLRPRPEVAARFAPPLTPWGAGHRGVDLVGEPGDRVRAALPGTVTYAGVLAGRGVLVVSHGPTRTTYEPVAATVSVGDHVDAGDRVGRLQPAPSHCLPRTCLHWGWIDAEGGYLDPLRLVGGGPVRLLPFLGSALGSAGVPGTPVDPVREPAPGGFALDPRLGVL